MYTLIVDDDKANSEMLKKYIMSCGDYVDVAENGDVALKIIDNARKHPFDLFVLNISMPGLNGFELCKIIRIYYETPIIFINGANDESLKIKAFELGCDDYIPAPVDPQELIARIKAIRRRMECQPNFKIIKLRDIVINLDARSVINDGGEIQFTPIEFDLLAYLVKNKGKCCDRIALLKNVWNWEVTKVDTKVVDTYIARIRRKLEKCGYDSTNIIVTVRGAGYKAEE